MFPISIGKAKNLGYDLPEFLCVALDSTSVRCRLSNGVEEFAALGFLNLAKLSSHPTATNER
jgi:hypothetical protein